MLNRRIAAQIDAKYLTMTAVDAVDGSSTGTLVPWEVGGS
jgi:hypothetical protein